jgi:hypothetical protein
VADQVAAIVVGPFEKPVEDARGISRVCDPGLGRPAVEAGDVVPGDRPPECVARFLVPPALDPGEEALDAWAVALDPVVAVVRVAGSSKDLPRPVIVLRVPLLDQNRHQILGPGEDRRIESSSSLYRGTPLSVLRAIAGTERLQPRPKGPLPAPES